MYTDLKLAFEKVTSGRDLTRAEARGTFERIMAGELADPAIGALLGALLTKGESVDELAGAAEAMHGAMVRISCDTDCIDTCGTGGDGISTYNVSTTAAIIAAAAGATVAKHGNCSTTRASGSTEVLSELGIDVEADRPTVERSLADVGIGYLNAHLLHPAMKYAAPVRRVIPVRTIFNLLGPLTNPAGAKRQVLGVPRANLLEMIAQALLDLGAVHAWVVHGADGLCDLTVTGPTSVMEVRAGCLRRFAVTPDEVGLTRGSLDELRVDSPAASAEIVRGILEGKNGAPRDHALMNAGAAVLVAGLAADLSEGVELAARAIDDGAGLDILRRWRSVAGVNATDTGKGRAEK